jgi:hypothetical protein
VPDRRPYVSGAQRLSEPSYVVTARVAVRVSFVRPDVGDPVGKSTESRVYVRSFGRDQRWQRAAKHTVATPAAVRMSNVDRPVYDREPVVSSSASYPDIAGQRVSGATSVGE